MEKITINWSGPYRFGNIGEYGVEYSNGIYAITRVWGDSEKLLYLGETVRGFTARLNKHQKEWLDGVRRQIKVRFGVLEFEQGRKYSKSKRSNVEELLINWHKPLYNTKSTNNYYGRDNLIVINKGRRGLLKKKISTADFD